MALKPCGTYAAYRRHLRNDEPVDDACAAAAREQKQARSDAGRDASAAVVALAVLDEPTPEIVDELGDALENLRIVVAAMREAPANSIAGLSKRREELAGRVARLQGANKPKESTLDQLAKRRAQRLAEAAN